MLMRLFLAIFVFLAALTPSFSAERAELSVIGYSPDGKYFAFEEYGIQDGSGFAYSSIYVVDLAADKWVEGSPFHVRAEDEEKSVFEIRATAFGNAADLLQELTIERTARLIAHKADGEFGDEIGLKFGVPGYSKPGDVWGEYELSLDIYKAPSPQICVDYTGELAMGFRLRFTDGEVEKILHEDSKVPQSRSCPVTYRVSAVAIPFDAYDLKHAVALISIWGRGFEGLDRRYMAIPISYENQ